jgi:hypothetical protein
MIAIGCATDDERAFRAGAARTIEAIDDGSSLLLRRHRYESIDVPYNEMLAVAAARDDLEAVVLVHQDAFVEVRQDIPARIRGLLEASPEVAVAGALEGGDPRELTLAHGTLLVLSAWAARELRFDPAVGGSADASANDISLQARTHGRRVIGAQFGVGRLCHKRDPAGRRRELSAMVALRRKWRVGAAPAA